MRIGGKLSAAIEVLDTIRFKQAPLKQAMRNWGQNARYAGAADRAWISGLVLDALRNLSSLSHHMQDDSSHSVVCATFVKIWDHSIQELEQAFKDPHAPKALSGELRSNLIMAPDTTAPLHIQGNFPEWLVPHIERSFGADALSEMVAMNVRASVDLRVNTLKDDGIRTDKALKTVRAEAHPYLNYGRRIPASDPRQKAPGMGSIPAFSKGWVEVQDAGSQIAAALAAAKPGEQVLDYCAGGGGKTLALAAQLENQGQIHAFDIDGRRLSALIPRLKRAGIRNTQLCDIEAGEPPWTLKNAMDVVFIDAPCTGTGTWRRRPASKWRLKPTALEKRLDTQAQILEAAKSYVKPEGRLIYATCSFLSEENTDQIDCFLKHNTDFEVLDSLALLTSSGLMTDNGLQILAQFRDKLGGLCLTPYRTNTDGFYAIALKKKA